MKHNVIPSITRQVATVEIEWRRVFGSLAEGASHMASVTGERDPRNLTWGETVAYLRIIEDRPDFKPAPMTQAELHRRAARF